MICAQKKLPKESTLITIEMAKKVGKFISRPGRSQGLLYKQPRD